MENFFKVNYQILYPNKAQIPKGSLFTHYVSLYTKIDHIYHCNVLGEVSIHTVAVIYRYNIGNTKTTLPNVKSN